MVGCIRLLVSSLGIFPFGKLVSPNWDWLSATARSRGTYIVWANLDINEYLLELEIEPRGLTIGTTVNFRQISRN